MRKSSRGESSVACLIKPAINPLPVFTLWPAGRSKPTAIKPLPVGSGAIPLPVRRPIQEPLEHTPEPRKVVSRIRREPPGDPHLLQVSVSEFLRHFANCLAAVFRKILEDSIKLCVGWLERHRDPASFIEQAASEQDHGHHVLSRWRLCLNHSLHVGIAQLRQQDFSQLIREHGARTISGTADCRSPTWKNLVHDFGQRRRVMLQ